MERLALVHAAAAAAATAFAWILKPHVLFGDGIGTSAYPNQVPMRQGPEESGMRPEDAAAMFAIEPGFTGEQQAAIYPQSVASGDPQTNGIVLWTRVSPSALGNPSARTVVWQIASNADFDPASVVMQGLAPIAISSADTVKLPTSNAVLAPYIIYFYRFIYKLVPSRTGRFKTLPSSSAELAQLKIGYVVCQDYNNGYYTALNYLAQEDVEYVVHLGDYIYETITVTNAVRQVPAFPSGGVIPQTVDDYRHLYRVYRSDPNQQAVHEKFAYIQLWDDHEFANDAHQDFHPDNNTLPVTAATPQPALRQAANQAWSEYGLADVSFDPSQDWENSIRVYRTFNFGTLMDLIVTDERLYRDGPPCGSNSIGERYFALGCKEMGDVTRTMLGLTQRQWFLDQLTSTRATWKIWANEVMLMQLKFGPVYIDLDQWDGYQQERNLILNTIKHQKVRNVVAITGDLHTFLAGYLKTDFDNPFEEAVGIELMVGSISSANLEEDIESSLGLPSAPVPAKHMGVAPNLLDPVIHAANPHIKYWDSSTHGYGILTITPALLTCEFKAVTTIRESDAAVVSLKTFTIPVNEVKLNTAR
jgi:alkaline phosphatase D